MSDRRTPVGPQVLMLRDELRRGTMRPLGKLRGRGLAVEVAEGRDSLWALIRRSGSGGLALRITQTPGGGTVRRVPADEGLCFEQESLIGRQRVTLALGDGEVPVLRVQTTLTPIRPLLVPFYPRDLYPLGPGDDPLTARGTVEAAQRGLNTGVCYLRLEKPAFGSVLYVQNFTSLNERFRLTKTKPDGAVGGEWPELGYLPPTPPQSPQPPLDPLPGGKPVQVYDALLAFHGHNNGDEVDQAVRYLTLLAAIYRELAPPRTHFRDWPARAERTLRDLDQAPEATIEHYGYRYIHPYTAAEYPDAMVQLTVAAALRDFEAWTREEIPLRAEFERGLGKFFDKQLGTMRRYLPNVGDDKDADAVDSWYLYHPLMNLARLALDGDSKARTLFLDSIDFGIRAAHHFDYCWPIQFKVTDFSVITEARNDDSHGQTDVGGFYAYVMLQAFELTDDKRFLDEARAAIRAARGMRFNLNYQANLTAWGAAACMRLWRIDDDPELLAQSYVYLASFFHNTAIWESEIGHARHYSNFMGATALHDAPYMAMFECFESFCAFERYLKDGGPDLDAGVRMLVSEYCRHALDRAWFYYPDALPKEAIAEKPRDTNGHIDRALSFPLEDLYVDGQQAGQVGQEIYGCGAAFAFATRSFHRFDGVPFTLFCDHFLMAADQPSKQTLSLQLNGGDGRTATLVVLPRSGARTVRVTTASGDRIRARRRDGKLTFDVPASGRITLAW